jgi:lipoyl(octanoyl) transferase
MPKATDRRRRTLACMRESTTPIAVVSPGLVDYQTAWDLQRSIASARILGTGPDTLILLEHPAVYTAGKRTQPEDRPVDGTPVIDVDRGGRITWHGPGQLVAYPIVKLAEAMNVVGYVRLLEQAIMAVCTELGLDTIRVTGRSGVWLPADRGRPERKIAAIGVRVAKGVTSHGLALNCNPDMSSFDRIVPCGIADAGVTSLTREMGTEITVQRVQPLMIRKLTDALDGRIGVKIQTAGQPAATAERAGQRTVGATLDNGVTWQLAPALQGS